MVPARWPATMLFTFCQTPALGISSSCSKENQEEQDYLRKFADSDTNSWSKTDTRLNWLGTWLLLLFCWTTALRSDVSSSSSKQSAKRPWRGGATAQEGPIWYSCKIKSSSSGPGCVFILEQQCNSEYPPQGGFIQLTQISNLSDATLDICTCSGLRIVPWGPLSPESRGGTMFFVLPGHLHQSCIILSLPNASHPKISTGNSQNPSLCRCVYSIRCLHLEFTSAGITQSQIQRGHNTTWFWDLQLVFRPRIFRFRHSAATR